jgi:hypothetical protein
MVPKIPVENRRGVPITQRASLADFQVPLEEARKNSAPFRGCPDFGPGAIIEVPEGGLPVVVNTAGDD